MERIDLLNRIIEELSKQGVPIVFKGAMLLNNILANDNPSNIYRKTFDIDGNWIGDNPDINEIRNYIQKAVNNINSDYHVSIVREFTERRSAGFKIYVDNNGKQDTIASIDISVKKVNQTVDYYSYINNITFKGVSLDKMITDKIATISTRQIYRRTKDLIDLYVLSFLTEFNYDEVFRILEFDNRELGDFEHFKNNIEHVEHAYSKLENISNKPSFEEVYERLKQKLKPFIDNPQPPDGGIGSFEKNKKGRQR